MLIGIRELNVIYVMMIIREGNIIALRRRGLPLPPPPTKPNVLTSLVSAYRHLPSRSFCGNHPIVLMFGLSVVDELSGSCQTTFWGSLANTEAKRSLSRCGITLT